jgi:hypothetical protein
MRVLATDLDDCLSPSFAKFTSYLEMRLGKPVAEIDLAGDYWSLPNAYGISTEVLFMHFREWIELSRPQELIPLAGCVEVFEQLTARGWELHVISARDWAVSDPTIQWVNYWFPKTFTAIHFCSHWGQGTRREKFHVLNEISATHFIDDALRHLEQAAVEVPAVHTILFGEYPWNISEQINPQLHEVRCPTWSDLLTALG